MSTFACYSHTVHVPQSEKFMELCKIILFCKIEICFLLNRETILLFTSYNFVSLKRSHNSSFLTDVPLCSLADAVWTQMLFQILLFIVCASVSVSAGRFHIMIVSLNVRLSCSFVTAMRICMSHACVMIVECPFSVKYYDCGMSF